MIPIQIKNKSTEEKLRFPYMKISLHQEVNKDSTQLVINDGGGANFKVFTY